MAELLMSGLELTWLGMAVVFTLLGTLVLATRTMSRIILHFETASPSAAPPAPVSDEESDEAGQIVAAAAAVHVHRMRTGGRGRKRTEK